MFSLISLKLFKYRGFLWMIVIAIISLPTRAELTEHSTDKHLTRQQWQQDLEALDADIHQYHVNPFWFKNEKRYRQLYRKAHNYIETSKTVDANRVNGYFEKLVAYISDGHSYVVNKAERFGVFAYRLEWFGDDLHIVSVEQGDSRFLGAKVLAFDGMSIEKANKRIAPYIPIVNSSSFKFHSRDAYYLAGLLEDAEISKSSQIIELTLELKEGNRVKKIFGLHNRENEFIDLHESLDVTPPLYRRQQDKYQWLTFLENERAVYLRYARVMEKNSGDIKHITDQLVHVLNNHEVQKLIIDVRDNGGGDSFFNAPLINAIAKNKAINQRSRLFVITNHNTFSAAINFSGNMEIKTRTIFVGEKVADRATFAGEAGPQAKHSLSNSGIVVSLSFSEWNSTYDNDRRDAIALDIPIKLTLQDFLAGRDPILQACLDYPLGKASIATLDSAKPIGWPGRYDYSSDKALKIYEVNGELQMEITELLYSSLHPHIQRTLKSDLTGIELTMLSNGDIEFTQSGSEKRILRKLRDDQLKPLELLMAGQFGTAKAAYQKIYAEKPKLLSIRGNSLGILASHLRAKYEGSTYYDQLRNIALSLYGEPIASWDEGE